MVFQQTSHIKRSHAVSRKTSSNYLIQAVVRRSYASKVTKQYKDLKIEEMHSGKNIFSQNRQFIKFLMVGAVNTIFGYGCFAALLYVGIHYAYAGMISTIAGIIFNFKSTGRVVFNSNNNSKILRFSATYFITYCIGTMGIGLFELIRVEPYIGGAIMIFPTALLSFYLNKNFVFNHD